MTSNKVLKLIGAVALLVAAVQLLLVPVPGDHSSSRHCGMPGVIGALTKEHKWYEGSNCASHAYQRLYIWAPFAVIGIVALYMAPRFEREDTRKNKASPQ